MNQQTMKESCKTDKDYNGLKFSSLFDKLNNLYAKLYRGTVILEQYIPKEHKYLSIKIYELCSRTG
jgi:hypothetical protein